ncbi:winged helix-turn-helix transcriptional regulator [Streptomyces griseorubiginosus]|uniref:HTH-type transcriptional regulator n=1 Tax=Streptomyces griseorubiginosus TaxID=67304 RepID=A0AAI8L1V9_9ACTN|nr:helix-turn-helix domain-containing protein [Streptomyces griseorubiginosus]AYC39805.1 putative HTH-type transcriptional regulator [Streptomyces griseorubiginosus]
MPAADRPHPHAFENAVAVVGDYWTLLVLQEVSFGARRFRRIMTNTGISSNVLAVRLRKLIERGVLSKELYESRPPRYEYTLTEAGRELQPVLLALAEWGNRHACRGESLMERHARSPTTTPRAMRL